MDEIHYLIGNSCNLNCDFCFWNKRFQDTSLDFKKKIIDQISAVGAKRITLSGGEPTKTNDFPKVLQYIKSKGIESILHTNGLDIDKKLATAIAKYASKTSLVFDGSDAEKTFLMRKSKTLFDQTKFLINFLADRNAYVGVKTVVTKLNLDDLEKIAEVLSTLPINYWTIIRFNPLNRGGLNKEQFFISTDSYNKITDRIKKKYQNKEINIKNYETHSSNYCFITANGQVYTFVKRKGDVLIGDLKKDKLNLLIQKIVA